MQKTVFTHCKDKRNELQQDQTKSVTGVSTHEVPSCIVLSGTRVLSGEGKMVVIVVGDLSCIGKIRAILMQEDKENTPLQEKLEIIATDIGKFGLVSGLLVFLIMFSRLIAEVII
jgi:magnesium-transporting ATPase (P-type)